MINESKCQERYADDKRSGSSLSRDHMEEQERKVMEQEQQRIMEVLGIPR